MAAGVPQGYDSKADKFAGITSQMRKNEKSKSPGYPGNSVSSAYQASVNNLIVKEKGHALNFKSAAQINSKDNESSDISILSDEVVTFPQLPSMQVNAADISAYVQTLDTEKSSVGVNDQYYNGDVPNMSILSDEISNTSVEQMINDGIPVHETLVTTDKRGSFAGSSAALGASVEPHKKTHISVETKAAESAAITESIEILAKDAEVKRVNNLSAMKQMGLAEWDTAPYVQDKELGTYEDDERMQTMYKPAVIEAEQTALLEKQRIKDELAAERAAAEAAAAAEARAKQQAIQKAKREEFIKSKSVAREKREAEEKKKEVWDRKEKQAGEPELWRDPIGRDYLESERQKEISEIQDKWTDNNKYVGRHSAEIHQEIAEFEKEDTLADRHPVFDLTKKELTGENQSQGLHKGEEQIQGAGRGVVVEETGARGKHLADVLSANQEYIDNLMNQGKGGRKAVGSMYLKDSGKGTHRSAGMGRYGFRKSDHDLKATDPYAFSTHAYPKDVVEDFTNGHYMLFYINAQNYTKYTYDGYDDKGKIVTVGDMVESHSEDVWTGGTGGAAGGGSKFWKDKWEMNKGANAGDVAYSKRAIAKGRKGNLLYHNQTQLKKSRKGPQTGLGSYYPTTTRITDSVALYLPPNVQDSTNASYNDFETGMAGFIAMGGVNILQQLRDHDFQGAASELITKSGKVASEALKKFALGSFGALTGSEGVRETFDKAFGQSLNPYLEVTFGNMGLRTFNYTFHFAPKSPDESLEVKDIIQLFRFHMAPELKGTNHRYLTIPSTFDIHYMFQSGMGDKTLAKENSFYSKIATCVLKGVDVNYTPGGVRSFDDGAPTQIDMTLNFQETEMLTKQKINEGY